MTPPVASNLTKDEGRRREEEEKEKREDEEEEEEEERRTWSWMTEAPLFAMFVAPLLRKEWLPYLWVQAIDDSHLFCQDPNVVFSERLPLELSCT